MSIMSGIVLALLVGMYIIAVYTDVRYRKIKNWLTLPAMLVGFLGCIYVNGLLSTIGFTLSLFVFSYICMMIPIWAEGDTKLYIAGGLLSAIVLGSTSVVTAAGILLIIVVIHLGIGHLIWLKRVRFNLISYFRDVVISIRSRPFLRDKKEKQIIAVLPGAITIAVGNLLYLAAVIINF